mmetsp:Transcript_31730/g.103676  ORF Transcript_31730/g.103676 Transcript_31730/m.103676 type:complete len:231 (-) Transcript_31730:1356-2048(-)
MHAEATLLAIVSVLAAEVAHEGVGLLREALAHVTEEGGVVLELVQLLHLKPHSARRVLNGHEPRHFLVLLHEEVLLHNLIVDGLGLDLEHLGRGEGRPAWKCVHRRFAPEAMLKVAVQALSLELLHLVAPFREEQLSHTLHVAKCLEGVEPITERVLVLRVPRDLFVHGHEHVLEVEVVVAILLVLGALRRLLRRLPPPPSAAALLLSRAAPARHRASLPPAARAARTTD